jgi:UrcA family protein
MNSKFQTINRAFLVHSTAMLLACVLVASNVRADEQVRSETVKFQDLNISTSAGAEALYSRIHSAALRVCSSEDAWLEQVAVASCIRDAEARAVKKVELPLLTAFYQMKTGTYKETVTANR